MDLAGIGAIASATVAALGIPAAVLIGRWQTKAAVRAAQATTEAVRAQAQATSPPSTSSAKRPASSPTTPTSPHALPWKATERPSIGCGPRTRWSSSKVPGTSWRSLTWCGPAVPTLSHAVTRTLNQRTPGQEPEGQPMGEDMAAAVTLLQQRRACSSP